MRISKLLTLLALALPVMAAAQSSSINTFSPYTFYGLGDISNPGPAYIRSMGGAGVAFRDPFKINYLNPAAMTAGVQKAFMLNVGLEGDNYYLKTNTQSTSYNTFNIRDLAVQFPLSRRMSMGASVTPFSSVGYHISDYAVDASMPGIYEYEYNGSGGITQMKAGMAYNFGKRISTGVEMVYYLGKIERDFDAVVTSYGTGSENSTYGSSTTKVSQAFVNFGLQYNAIITDKQVLTIGATFQPEGKLKPKVSRLVPSGDLYGDTISYDVDLSNFKMPAMATVGVSYNTQRLVLNADYTYQGWGVNSSSDLSVDGVSYRNTNSFKFGGQYTPDRNSVRSFYKRLSYRFGVRYSDYYMTYHNGVDVSDRAVTFGVGIPLRAKRYSGTSAINLGVEIGSRGSVSQNMIRENYFKFSIGLSLFGEDRWFWKPKYD